MDCRYERAMLMLILLRSFCGRPRTQCYCFTYKEQTQTTRQYLHVSDTPRLFRCHLDILCIQISAVILLYACSIHT